MNTGPVSLYSIGIEVIIDMRMVAQDAAEAAKNGAGTEIGVSGRARRIRSPQITAGGGRQDNYGALTKALPRGSFAIGRERSARKLPGLANAQEASLFPRDRKRVEP